jgi:hypothetical protein
LDHGAAYGDFSNAGDQCCGSLSGSGNTQTLQGSYQAGGWPGKGRGKGFRGDWQSLPDSRPDNKGAKGKGKKGKGKARGKGSWDWNQQNNEWKDSKEKPAEKTA